MKRLEALFHLSALVSCVCLTAAADTATTNKETELPTQVNRYRVVPDDVKEEANRLATSELRVAYLASVIATNAVDTNAVQNFRKSSALRLLSVIKNTNAIAILVSNITFVDTGLPKFPRRPAYSALEKIGEPAVASLMDVIKDPSAPPDKLELVVEVLRFIKNKNPGQWDKFVDEQKKTLPPELWGRTDRKIWEQD